MLSRSAKPSQFTKFLTPDARIPTIESSESAPKELLRKARQVVGSFTWVVPEKRAEAELKWVSEAALKDLGFKDGLTPENWQEFAKVLSGTTALIDHEKGLYPFATNYAGDQFGSWAGQLGDGRAITLFNINGYEIQLKGGGLTPYSRFADGKAVLRSSIREALCSEYVNQLGIPTQRCLSLASLPETFARRERVESCAVIARMAQSWVRIGNFQLHYSRGDRGELRRLADYCIDVLHLGKGDEYAATIAQGGEGVAEANRYFHFYRDSALRNARMMAKCQAYGFLNGVLNTDNVSILGLSIDYGPFAFMDVFDSTYTPNHDDYMSRYGFQNAPTYMWWNFIKLSETLGELIGSADNVDDPKFVEDGFETKPEALSAYERATKLIMGVGDEFQNVYETEYQRLMMNRLGIFNSEEPDDLKLVEDLLKTMQECELDYNGFFRKLSHDSFDIEGDDVNVDSVLPEDRERKNILSDAEAAEMVKTWFKRYQARKSKDPVSEFDRKRELRKINPNFVLRNSVVANVIALAERGNWDAFDAVAKMSLAPFEDTWDVHSLYHKRYLGEVPLSDRDSQLSCSS